MNEFTLTVDGRMVTAREGQTVLEACIGAGVRVPRLCHDPRLEPYGGCRLCVVQIEGMRGFPTSCTTQVSDGMVVTTQSPDLHSMRKTVVELLLSDHNISCLSCDSSGRCDLQDLAYEFEIVQPRYVGETHRVDIDDDNPLIHRDLTKCISCGRCVRICDEVQGATVYGYHGRGFNVLPDTPYSESLTDSNCEFCGQCISTCPVGALTDKRAQFRARAWETQKIESICGYCGVGCTVSYEIKDGRIVRAAAPLTRGVNRGNLCVKGRWGWSFTQSPERLTVPLVRREGELVETTWDEAIALIAAKLGAIVARHGAGAVGGLASAKCTNEENYLFQKFLRGAIGTHNIDHCARLCHSSTVSGLAASFGSGAMTNSIGDLALADVALVIGSNTTEAHPIIGNELTKAARRGLKIIVADPREIRLVRQSTSWLQLRPGTNVALINAMMRVILDEGLENREFIEQRTEGFEALESLLLALDLDAMAEACGVPLDHIRAAAIAYASAPAATILYSMGVTQHSSGTEQVRAVANLAMITGQIGRPGTGVNPLRGQNNVQGACDLACLPNCLPGYQPLTSRGTLDRFCDYWESDIELPETPGLTVVEMLDAAARGELKALYVMGENPALSDPDQTHVIEALKTLDFLIVQDIFLTETTEFADVVLPAATFLEKSGTFTNTERRVQLVNKVVEPPGQALPDGEIIVRIAAAMGFAQDYDSPSEIMDEMSAVTPQYGGISYRRLRQTGGIQWPCPDDDHPGTPILHTAAFTRGLGEFAPVTYRPACDSPTPERPYILTTGRHLWNFHTNTMTGASGGLYELNPTGYVELHPADAEKIGVCDGDRVRIESSHGQVDAPVRVCTTERVPRAGVAFMPFHFADTPANRLTGGELDPTSKIPDLKVTAVSITRLTE
jgi:formate dehydrogenase alpha subunit